MSTAKWIELKTNHYQTPKSIKIIMRFGWEGYGLYMALLQKLAQEENRAFALIEMPALAFELHCTTELLKLIINNYFDTDELIFWSDELNDLMVKYDESFIKFSEMGKKSAANMTPEQRKERARKGAGGKWHKNDIDSKNNENAN
jgi:hypothetical protein